MLFSRLNIYQNPKTQTLAASFHIVEFLQVDKGPEANGLIAVQ